MNTTREYVEVNFTEEEKLVFNFILNSFPESILVDDDGIENEDLLALLAVIAKAIGNSRELINNLTTAHSAEELYNKIEDSYFTYSNKELLLLLIKDLNIPIFKDKTKEEQRNLLSDNNIKNLVLNSYLLTKDRGTNEAIKNIIDFTLYKTLADKEIEITGITKQSTITNGNGQVVIGLPLVSLTSTPISIRGNTQIVDNVIKNSNPAKIISKGNNLFDKVQTKSNTSLQSDGKTEYSEPLFGYTLNYIPVKPNSNYIRNNTNGSIYFYDINKNLISYLMFSTTFTTPDNTSFVRFAFLYSVIDDLQLNEGTTALPYQPYAEHEIALPDLSVQFPNGLGRLPNEVYDSVDMKRLGRFVLNDAMVDSVINRTDDRNRTDVLVIKPIDYIGYDNAEVYNDRLISNLDYELSPNHSNLSYIYFYFPLNTTLQEARDILRNSVLQYQLATPIPTGISLPTIPTYDGGTTIIVDNNSNEDIGELVKFPNYQVNLEQLIDFSFNNYNKINDPLNPDYFIESASGYDMYNIDTDTITYKTLMNSRPAGIFYNILIEYISDKLFSNMTGDEVISHEEQLLTNNIIQLDTIAPPGITVIAIYTDNDQSYDCVISYINSNRFVPLILNIDITNIDTSPIAQKEIPMHQAKSGTVYINFNTAQSIEDGQYTVKAYFNGDDTDSTEVSITTSHIELVDGVELVQPTVVEIVPTNTLDITSSNNVPVGIEILETWTYNDSQYLTRKYLYDGLTEGSHMYHPILNPSTMYNLNLAYSVKFTLSSLVSPEYSDAIEAAIDSGTYAYQYSDVISNIEIVGDGVDGINDDRRYTPYVEVRNPNSNCLNYYIYQEYYEYLPDKDGPGQIIFTRIPSETPMVFIPGNIINSDETKKLYLPQSPLIDGSNVLGKYVIVFGHENTSTTIIETNGTNYIVIPSRQIIENDLKPYTTILSKGKLVYQTDSYGYLNIKTSINPQLCDTSKFSLVCNFVINWKDPASGQLLGTSHTVVEPSGVNNNEFSVTRYANPYNRTVNATVEPMIEIKVLANNIESHFVLQQETIENILNNYGGE